MKQSVGTLQISTITSKRLPDYGGTPDPTEHFTVLRLQNPLIDVSELNKICRSTDFGTP